MFSRRLVHLLLTSLLTLLAVLPAAAAPPDTSITRTTRLSLEAFSEEGVGVFLFQHPDGGYEVCVSTRTGFGCTTVGADAVQLDEKNLTSATLAPTTILLQRCGEFGCEPGEEVTVALTFTGTGELTKFQSRFKSMNGCKMMGSTKGIQRQGEATITIGSETYDADGFLAIAQETFKVQCRH